MNIYRLVIEQTITAWAHVEAESESAARQMFIDGDFVDDFSIAEFWDDAHLADVELRYESEES